MKTCTHDWQVGCFRLMTARHSCFRVEMMNDVACEFPIAKLCCDRPFFVPQGSPKPGMQIVSCELSCGVQRR